jgi:peptidase E
MDHSGTIVQFGSGRPGEEDSESFEQELFEELALTEADLVFIPFHELPSGQNDWTRFKAIYGPLTSGSIELVELAPFAPQREVRRIEARLRAARVIVLGSGLVEPYMAALVLSGLDRTLAQLHSAGAVLFGYSAGALALGAEFRHLQTGGELLESLEELLAAELRDTPPEAAAEAFCSMFAEAPPPRRLLEMLRRRRLLGPEALAAEPFLTEVQARSYCPGLDLVPGVAAYPHFEERHQCSLPILKRLYADHPETRHVGLPNATALVTRFGPKGPQIVVRGRHPRHRVTWIEPSGAVRLCSDRDEIPAPLVSSIRVRRPQAGIV